jgi:hypothetical protein
MHRRRHSHPLSLALSSMLEQIANAGKPANASE